MRRLIFNLFLIFAIHEIFSTVAATEYESCPLDRKLEDLCSSYTYTVVRPMLDYYRQVSDELQQSHAKDELIRDLREKLVRHEGNEALIKQLQSQINFQMKIITEKNEEIAKMHRESDVQVDDHNKQILNIYKDLKLCQVELEILNNFRSQMDFHKQTMDKLTASLKLFENYNKCKEELAQEAKKLQICEGQLSKVNSSVIEKDEIFSRNNMKTKKDSEDHKVMELKLEQSQAELLNKGKDQELCQSEVDKLNETSQNNIPSSCIPFGEYPGIRQIKISDVGLIDVLCDSQLAGPGWLVIQQRVGGNENFTRSWVSYRDGFGSLESDFFLGLEMIHRLTNSQRYELYIHLVAENGTTYYARYDEFKITDEDNGYALSLGQFEGNTEDAMRYQENMKFSTFDRDDDIYTDNCALYYKSGWWYKDCFNCNLNAIYGKDLTWYNNDPIENVKMLIRPKV